MESGVRRLSFSGTYFKEFDWMDEVNLEGVSIKEVLVALSCLKWV